MEKHGLPAVYNALMSGFGEEIGTGDIRYIQDIGQKLEGTPYLDKNTNKLYLCVATTNSTNNDSSFMRFDMKEAFAKLNNLVYVSEVKLNLSPTPTYAFVRKSNNVCSLHIDYASGALKNATINSIIGNLPIGYRPSINLMQYKIGYNGFRFTLSTNGNITLTGLPPLEQMEIATYVNLTYIV